MKDIDSNGLIAIILVLSVALFGAYYWKTSQMETGQQWQQDNGWPSNPGWQPSPNPNPTFPERRPPVAPNSPRNYSEALKLSQSLNKPLFVFLEMDNCRYCDKMKRETLADPSVHSALSKYIVYMANKDRDYQARSAVGGRSYPAYGIVSNGQVTKKDSGYKSPQEFVRWLNGRSNPFDRNNRDRRRPG